jgi:hypothetical protein
LVSYGILSFVIPILDLSSRATLSAANGESKDLRFGKLHPPTHAFMKSSARIK